MALRKRSERKILHDYMVWLSEHHECEEPDRVSGSMCEIYNTLNGGNSNLGLINTRMISMFLISISIFMYLSRKEFLVIREKMELIQKSITGIKSVEKWFS